MVRTYSVFGVGKLLSNGLYSFIAYFQFRDIANEFASKQTSCCEVHELRFRTDDKYTFFYFPAEEIK